MTTEEVRKRERDRKIWVKKKRENCEVQEDVHTFQHSQITRITTKQEHLK